MDHVGIDTSACRQRQQRLLDWLDKANVDVVVVTQLEHVQWLTGPRFAWVTSPAAALLADGTVLLVAPQSEPSCCAADVVLTYPAKSYSTLRNDQRALSSEVLVEELKRRVSPRCIGVEFSSCGPHLSAKLPGDLIDVEPQLYQLRRRKEADELARLRKAISGTERMYARAREIIRPGITELEIFNELQLAGVIELGEMMTGTGNDYQCNSRGGPPRQRQIEAGELYILDLGPAYRGYFADNARTIAVTEPSADQVIAWEYVLRAFEHVESTVRPGLSCRRLFHEVQAMLDSCPVGLFNHHLGHGIGLSPHEPPHLNPNWEDHFQAGDVFACEPGLYDAERLRSGIRIENDYLVTENGVELLTLFDLAL